MPGTSLACPDVPCGHQGGSGTIDAIGISYRRTVAIVCLGVLVLAVSQAAYASSTGSGQLLRDAIDWTYTILLNGIAAYVYGRGERIERGASFAIVAILVVGGFHALYEVAERVAHPHAIDAGELGFTATSAVVVACAAALALARFRREDNPLIQATWISARNDTIATTFSSLATVAIEMTTSRWAEHALDLFGAAMTFQAAYATYRATRRGRAADSRGDMAVGIRQAA